MEEHGLAASITMRGWEQVVSDLPLRDGHLLVVRQFHDTCCSDAAVSKIEHSGAYPLLVLAENIFNPRCYLGQSMKKPPPPPQVYVYMYDVRGKPPYNDPIQAARRKPSGVILREAMHDYREAARHGVLYVGDRPEDRATAVNAGVTFQWAHIFFGA